MTTKLALTLIAGGLLLACSGCVAYVDPVPYDSYYYYDSYPGYYYSYPAYPYYYYSYPRYYGPPFYFYYYDSGGHRHYRHRYYRR